MNFKVSHFIIFLFVTFACSKQNNREVAKGDFIQPFKSNPLYWQYEKEPLLLRGGAVSVNPFQSDNPEKILDSLKNAGGNYLINILRSSDSSGLWPFKKLKNGKYDLRKWNNLYWKKLRNFIKLANKKDIIIQLVLWDKNDYNRESWTYNPFNPVNNINYKMKSDLDKNIFFNTINKPSEYKETIRQIKTYQKSFVKKVLSVSLEYNNILYSISNISDSSLSIEWNKYWIKLINNEAKRYKKDVYTTGINGKFITPDHCKNCSSIFNRSSDFSFLDISEVNKFKEEEHWEALEVVNEYMSDHRKMPVNHGMVYGGDSLGNYWEGTERFCRNFTGGAAACCHYPQPLGNGMNNLAVGSIKAFDKVQSRIKIWNFKPAMNLLSECSENEAYLAYNDQNSYLIYFPKAGKIKLDLRNKRYYYKVHFINVKSGNWGRKIKIMGGKRTGIVTPNADGWLTLVKKM